MILNDSMYKIEEIYNKLNCNSSVETQSEGKKLARNITDLSLLIQPDDAMMAWKNCAVVLSEKSDGELAPYSEKLLEV